MSERELVVCTLYVDKRIILCRVDGFARMNERFLVLYLYYHHLY